jgi:hypothetical protein
MNAAIHIYIENGNTVFDAQNLVIYTKNVDCAINVEKEVKNITLKNFTIVGNYNRNLWERFKIRLVHWLLKSELKASQTWGLTG